MVEAVNDLVHSLVALEHWLVVKAEGEEHSRMAKEGEVVRLKLVEVAVGEHLKMVEEADEERLLKVVGELMRVAAEDLKVCVTLEEESEVSSQLVEEGLASKLMNWVSVPQIHLFSGDLQ